MWPFSRKSDFPGIVARGGRLIRFKLTDDESAAIDRALGLFKDFYVHPDVADKIRNGVMAAALSIYAKDLVRFECMPEDEEKADRRAIQVGLRKAVAALWKASSLYQLPVLLFHRATVLHMLGMEEDSKRLFALFLEKQRAFVPDSVDGPLIKYEDSDVEFAIVYAEHHLANS